MVNKMYSLPEICFVGGSSEILEFKLYYSKNNPQPFNLVDGDANFSIVYMSNKNGSPIVSKRMTAIENTLSDGVTVQTILRVILDPIDTVNLFGKFVYQITIKDADGSVDIPSQGIINIVNNIDKDFITGGNE